ncbi:hypothetical protein CTAYLR_005474 [Chrysophaeum taylorii]|uniref:Uncharacterized protein n=1 Tax=Chrysophaeum taylorii TaxID=2483200 RepID=A0AAD7U520_9STRA|nr:hypothetical protein CTAYLR_005474 [Chrysophaeum taylorii]
MLLGFLFAAEAFVVVAPRGVVRRRGFFAGGWSEEENVDDKINNNNTASSDLYAALRSRQRQVEKEGAELTVRWRKGKCTSRVVAALGDDWVRRCALDWPLCALGTASGSVHVVDVSKPPRVLAQDSGTPAHVRYYDGGQDLSPLHGAYDGGGVTAIALTAATLATGGRAGDVKLWNVNGPEVTLEATMRCGEGVVVSALCAARGTRAVFAACLDGSVRRYDPEWRESWCERTGDPVLSLALHPTERVLACGLADGTVVLLNALDGTPVGDLRWRPFDASGARSVAFAFAYLYAASSDGQVKRRLLDDDLGAYVDKYDEQLGPPHDGPVVSLAARPGILATAAQDGTLRIWDLGPRSDKQPPPCLFGFGGFKVWIGSVDCDDRRLISDGSDNTIIMHDFGPDAASPNIPPSR